MEEHRLDLTVVKVLIGDTSADEHEWMAGAWLGRTSAVDAALGMVLSVLSPDFTVLVQRDHASSGTSHYSNSPEDINITCMGKETGVKRGHLICALITQLDTAPTLARLTGIPPHSCRQGTPRARRSRQPSLCLTPESARCACRGAHALEQHHRHARGFGHLFLLPAG